MKILIFAIILALILPIGAWANSHFLVERCESLLTTVEQSRNDGDCSELIAESWNELRKIAAYTTPYELLRNVNNACEGYLSRLETSEDAGEVNAAYVQFKSCLEDFLRLHSLSPELIF